jgi:hypothetical protein
VSCLCIHETTEHLTNCNFTEAAWNQVASKFSLPSYNDMPGPVQWILKLVSGGSKKKRRKENWICSAFFWLIWKERNKRIFENKHSSAMQVARLAQEEINIQMSIFDQDQ